MGYARAGHRGAVERVLALADLPAASTWSGRHGIAMRSGAGSNDLNAVVSPRGYVPDRAVLEELRSWWDGAPASWLVEESDAVFTRTLLDAGWTPERTGRWCGRSLGRSPFVTEAGAPEAVVVERVADDDALEQWLDVAFDCGWIEDLEDRVVRRHLLRGSAGDPREALWLAHLEGRPVGMARGWCSAHVVEVVDAAVRHPARRTGVGTALVSAVLSWGATRGVRTVVAAPSPDGWHLFDRLGFENVPVIPDTCFYWTT